MHAHAPEATPRPEMLVRPRESSVVLVLDAVSADGCRGHEGVGSRRCCCCCGGCCRIRPRRWPPLAAGRCCTNASTPVLPNHSGVAARRAAALARLALVMAVDIYQKVTNEFECSWRSSTRNLLVPPMRQRGASQEKRRKDASGTKLPPHLKTTKTASHARRDAACCHVLRIQAFKAGSIPVQKSKNPFR